MKILVISDSHGNIANLKHVIGFAKEIKTRAVIHCGDWNTLETVETVLSSGVPLYSVLGNADIRLEVEEKLSRKCKKFDRVFLELEFGGRKIGITHRPGDVKKYFEGKDVDVVFCGHLHSKHESETEGIKVVRPGAIINGINFAVYETVNNRVEFFDDEK